MFVFWVFLFYIHGVEIVTEMFDFLVQFTSILFGWCGTHHSFRRGKCSACREYSILFHFFFLFSIGDFILHIYIHAYCSCYWKAGCISQLNTGSLDHLSFTWQQQAAEAAETVVGWLWETLTWNWKRGVLLQAATSFFVFVETAVRTDVK